MGDRDVEYKEVYINRRTRLLVGDDETYTLVLGDIDYEHAEVHFHIMHKEDAILLAKSILGNE